jgi:hypothetical protein
MVLFFTIALVISLVGMLSMLSLKRYEITTGRVVFSGLRPIVSTLLSNTLVWLQKILPMLLQNLFVRGISAARTLVHRLVAQSILAFEYVLESVLHTVREKTAPQRHVGEVSAFLREVADHKKKLLGRDRIVKE